VTIAGAGSEWDAGSELRIGQDGAGELELLNGASVTAGTVNIGAAGALRGEGLVALTPTVGLLTNRGAIDPGDSLGTLTIQGSYFQTTEGRLQIQLDPGGTHDVLDVQGNVSLSGALELSSVGDLDTLKGLEIAILTVPSGMGVITGEFAQITPSDKFLITYEPTAVIIQVAPDPCPADIAPEKGNGDVDIDDLFSVIAGWGPCPDPCASSTCAADIAPQGGDCQTDIDDLFAVIGAWGACP
jgi:T5SS/PEP-CTERM-associated repeat protein